MATTRQIWYEKFGEPGQVLRLRTVELSGPGPGEVLLRIVRTPVHPADLAGIRSFYAGAREPGYPGMEAVGVVEAGDGLAAGTRVAFFHAGLWSDRVVAPTAGLVPVPDALADDDACQLFINPLSARLLYAGLPVDGWAIQAAANSAVGLLVDRFARRDGRRLVNLVRRDAARDELRAGGAEHVVSTAGEGWMDEVRAIAGDAPITGALDPVGGATGGAIVELLGSGGVVTVYGGLAGGAPVQVPVGALVFKDVTVRGFWLGRWFASASPDAQQAAVGEVIAGFAGGDVAIKVDATYDLANFTEAVTHAERPKAGKVLFAPKGGDS